MDADVKMPKVQDTRFVRTPGDRRAYAIGRDVRQFNPFGGKCGNTFHKK